MVKFFSNTYNSLNDSGIFLFDCWNNEIVKKKQLKDTKKIIFFKNYKIIRIGNIIRKVKSKIEVSYTFRIYKKNKLIDVFYEKHNLCSFTTLLSSLKVLPIPDGKYNPDEYIFSETGNFSFFFTNLSFFMIGCICIG